MNLLFKSSDLFIVKEWTLTRLTNRIWVWLWIQKYLLLIRKMLKNDCSDNTHPFLKTIIYETKRIQRETKTVTTKRWLIIK